MIQHFQYKSLYQNNQLPGWDISFYFKGMKHSGNYLKDGTIEWTSPSPPKDDEQKVKQYIHDLMLFHVYE
ncbi:YheE family protein [Bacillus sp. 2205SS5-2]|uniref:YheE family protein n=1 Tax=Bacillus sp. 2205SS5-2 TaxID=3109031 RepID=UPI003003D3A3